MDVKLSLKMGRNQKGWTGLAHIDFLIITCLVFHYHTPPVSVLNGSLELMLSSFLFPVVQTSLLEFFLSYLEQHVHITMVVLLYCLDLMYPLNDSASDYFPSVIRNRIRKL